ncbi:MAG: AAA family ATPase [Proteiniphilum sp.]
MYISQLRIKNFRVFDEIALSLNKGINILIGENNSGKTTIIDALRICLGYGKSDTNIYIQECMIS